MNNELKEMLASVMKEALQPIHEELQNVKSKVTEMSQRLTNVKTELKDFRNETITSLRMIQTVKK